jgi:hypothetical protein
MKKIILLLTILTIGYACKKETVEPISITNKVQQQDVCDYAGFFTTDSAATMVIANQGVQDTIVHNLTVEIIFVGDTFLQNINAIRCKYKFDSVTKALPFLSYSSWYNLESHAGIPNLANYQSYDTLALYTKTGRYFRLVRQ